MVTRQERLQEGKDAAEKFLNTLDRLFNQPNTTISKLDERKYEDQWLALEIALRGKSEAEYWSIIEGLSMAHDNETDEVKKGDIMELTTLIMRLGARNLNIDWNHPS